MATSIAFDIIARDRASATFDKLGRSVDNSGSKLSKFGKVAGVVARGGAVIGGALALVGGQAIKTEAQFSKTMNVLEATLKAPQGEMEKLRDLAKRMGAETVFSANDASAAMLELARGGMKAAAIQGGALQGTLTLAAAGELEMGEAANIAVKSMGQFNLKGKDMAGVAAALAGGANASSASVRDMSQALAQGGLAANSVGFSLQESTAVLAAFSNAGLEGSDAGTSLKTMLDRLQPATDKAATAMKRLGVMTKDGQNQFIDANGEFRSAAEIAEVLKKGTEDLSQAERKRLITQAFGSDAQRAATIFAEEGAEGLNKLLKATSDTDAAQQMAAANTKGTAGALERLQGSAENALLTLGEGLAPAVVKVADFLANDGIPAVVQMGQSLASTLGPAISKVAGWVKSELLPALGGLARDVLPAAKSAMSDVVAGFKAAQPFFSLAGKIITNVLIPVIGKLAKIVLPQVGRQIKLVGEGLGALGDIGIWLWNNALQPTFKFIVGGVAKILAMWSTMLRALAKVPGFGWAADAADKLAAAAGKAQQFADNINKIDTHKTVQIDIFQNVHTRRTNEGGGFGAVDDFSRAIAPRQSSVMAPRGVAATARADRTKWREVFRGVGRDAVQGFMKGIDDNANKAASAMDRMMKAISKAVDKENISKKAASMMREVVRRIAAEADKMRAALAERLDFGKSIASSLRDELDLGALVAGGGGFDAIVGGVSGLATRIRAFASQLRGLGQAGYPAALIREVAGLGSEQGMTVATALLNVNSGQRASLSRAFKAFNNAAGMAGNEAATAVYGSERSIRREYRQDIQINVRGALDPREVAKQIEQMLIRRQRESGRPLQFRTV